MNGVFFGDRISVEGQVVSVSEENKPSGSVYTVVMKVKLSEKIAIVDRVDRIGQFVQFTTPDDGSPFYKSSDGALKVINGDNHTITIENAQEERKDFFSRRFRAATATEICVYHNNKEKFNAEKKQKAEAEENERKQKEEKKRQVEKNDRLSKVKDDVSTMTAVEVAQLMAVLQGRITTLLQV